MTCFVQELFSNVGFHIEEGGENSVDHRGTTFCLSVCVSLSVQLPSVSPPLQMDPAPLTA